MDINQPIDDTTLHAYVDGQLAASEAAQVALWLKAHPDQAARVLTWQAQRQQLQALHAELLDEAVPPHLLAALHPPRRLWREALAASVLLLLGLGLGWWSRPWLDGATGLAVAPANAVPAYVRDAALAHVLYTPEQRHPVEVGAEQQQHLVQWLSRRLGAPLRVPVLTEQGWNLVGGRLLPAGETPPGADPKAPAPIARAQFMYETRSGERLTLYVAVAAAHAPAPTAFALTQAGEGAQRSFYWTDGTLGYALTGVMPSAELAELAGLVHRQLGG
jgi:anti-sigma factor RsiW